jgi:hypothetical protein
MDRSLRQITMLGKATAFALSAAPVFLLLSALIVQHNQISLPASVESTSHTPEGSVADAGSTTSKAGPVSLGGPAIEMLRPELTLSLMSPKSQRTPTVLRPFDGTSLFSASISRKASAQPTMTIERLISMAEGSARPVSPTHNITPLEQQTNETPLQTSSTESAASLDGSSELAWPDQWLAPRSAPNKKQNTPVKVEKGKAHISHIRLAQKEKKSSPSTAKKDLSGAEDDQNYVPPPYQPNIEDGAN